MGSQHIAKASTTKTTIRVTLFLPRRDSALTLLPGTLCQRRMSIPIYKIEINVNGII